MIVAIGDIARHEAIASYLAAWNRLLALGREAEAADRPMTARHRRYEAAIVHCAAIAEELDEPPPGLGEFGPHRLP